MVVSGFPPKIITRTRAPVGRDTGGQTERDGGWGRGRGTGGQTKKERDGGREGEGGRRNGKQPVSTNNRQTTAK